ncbi:MAG: MBL fold metallo-hydrolase [Pseudomonadota bacterium]
MRLSRRSFLASGAATVAGVTVAPMMASGAGHGTDLTFDTAGGLVKVHPVSHASVVMETPRGVLYIDPVGASDAYAGKPAPDLVLVTHEHGDHYNAETIAAVRGDAPMVVNPRVMELMPETLKPGTTVLANGDSGVALDIGIDAIPAHNTTEGRMQFHPPGRDNGYVLTMGAYRVYISGDTEDIPEMRALQNIDLAFLCMNLPFTMGVDQAADAVREFRPGVVIPYHYRGRGEGTQDPKEFAALVGDASEVRFGEWYDPPLHDHDHG